MFIRAYLRASTVEQDAGRAKDQLKSFTESHNKRIAGFYIEHRSGNTLERPELFRLLDESEAGDVLLIESIDRLTRLKAEDWDRLMALINKKAISIVSVDLPTSHMTFTSFPSDEFMASILKAINGMLLDILAASAYRDYKLRETRQAQGIAKAKKDGSYKGRSPDLDMHEKVKTLLGAGLSLNKTAETVGVSRRTVSRIKKNMIPDDQQSLNLES